MNGRKLMKTMTGTTLMLATLIFAATAAPPNAVATNAERPPSCSVERLAGRWLFATDVGQFPAFGGDITALGTMNIDRLGSLQGTFDATVAQVGFLPGNTYGGSVVVSSDCTGTLSFETSAGTVRTDSIAIVGRNEFWGMSRDPENLWTYRARRLTRKTDH